MPYKDKQKQKEANRRASAKRRAKGMTQGMTNEGMTQGPIKLKLKEGKLFVNRKGEVKIPMQDESISEQYRLSKCPAAKPYKMTDFEREHYKPVDELRPGEFNPVSKPGDEHYKTPVKTEHCRYCGADLPGLEHPRKYTGACIPCAIKHGKPCELLEPAGHSCMLADELPEPVAAGV